MLITSRRTLDELPSVRPVPLDVLGPDEAIELLRRTAGGDHVDAEPDIATHIAGLLGHLPLALALAASRIRANPDWTLADHLERLEHHRRGLRLENGVEVAISRSYRDLPTDRQRAFRLLALHPGNDITVPAATALTGGDTRATGHHLEQLTAGARRAALARLTDHYLHTAGLAMDLVYPHEKNRRPTVSTPPSPSPALADQAAARTWLDTESANLLAVATPGRLGHAVLCHAAPPPGRDRSLPGRPAAPAGGHHRRAAARRRRGRGRRAGQPRRAGPADRAVRRGHRAPRRRSCSCAPTSTSSSNI